jgi:hypothetical protein
MGRMILDGQAGNIPVIPEHSLAFFRRKYNAGKLLTASPGRKGPISFKYNEQGERITNYYCRGATPNLLPQREYDRILKTYGPDHRETRDFDFTVKEPKRNKVKKPRGQTHYNSFDWVI